MRSTFIRRRFSLAALGATSLLLAGLVAGCVPEKAPPPDAAAKADQGSPAPETPAMPVAAPTDAEVEKVGSCDGEHTVTLESNTTGQARADALMDQWLRDHPEADWVTEQKERHALLPPADNSGVLEGGQGKDHAYGNFTEVDVLTWKRETEKFVAEGSRIFHDADALGSTVAVSCDMCHPHASNTHPETYPKFQTQLGRVALLRDMIDWCIENPVRGEHLDPNGPQMRALEAYIMAQRKGVEMNFGKH
jgi:hypothetical protein